MRALVDSWASTIQAYLDFRELCCVHWLSSYSAAIFEGMADFNKTSNFFESI